MGKVKLGEVYQGEVIDYTYDGLGIVKIEGFCVFIESVIIEEVIEFEIIEVKKNLSFGKLKQVIKKSPFRVEPKCSNYLECGGCQLMHMNYQAQIEFKKNHVLKEVNKYLKTNLEEVNMIFSNKLFRYRNKLAVPFGIVEGKLVKGLYKKGTHDIIEATDCLICDETSYKVVNKVYEYALNLPELDNIRHVVVRQNYNDELMLIVVSKKELPLDIVDYVRGEFPQIVSIINNINYTQTNVILGQKNIVLYGEDYFYDKLLENTFKVSSKSFFQVNRIQTEKLYTEACSFLDYDKETNLIDLYSGIGSIGLTLAKSVNKVIGIEVVEDAVKMANENASINEINNAIFVSGKSEDLIEKYIKEYETIIVDPPRKGLDNKLKDVFKQNKVNSIVYISCNPSTLIRDIKDLDMEIKELTLCDMFVNTYHVECVALLTLKSNLAKK